MVAEEDLVVKSLSLSSGPQIQLLVVRKVPAAVLIEADEPGATRLWVYQREHHGALEPSGPLQLEVAGGHAGLALGTVRGLCPGVQRVDCGEVPEDALLGADGCSGAEYDSGAAEKGRRQQQRHAGEMVRHDGPARREGRLLAVPGNLRLRWTATERYLVQVILYLGLCYIRCCVTAGA